MAICRLSRETIARDPDTGAWVEEYSRNTHPGPCYPTVVVVVEVLPDTDDRSCYYDRQTRCGQTTVKVPYRVSDRTVCTLHLTWAITDMTTIQRHADGIDD
jgi:hypothetical protein